jgi:hypothetical protein
MRRSEFMKPVLFYILFFVSSPAFLPGSLEAAGAGKITLSEKGWITLIQGDNLARSGWKLARKPDEKHVNGWTIENGVLSNTVPRGKGSIDIVHEKKFKDFELHLEFLVPPRQNSGVYLRGCYESVHVPVPEKASKKASSRERVRVRERSRESGYYCTT